MSREFGTEFRRLRDKANLPKAHVAEAVRYDVSRWSAVESGKEIPPAYLISKAAESIGAGEHTRRLQALAMRDQGWTFCNLRRLPIEAVELLVD